MRRVPGTDPARDSAGTRQVARDLNRVSRPRRLAHYGMCVLSIHGPGETAFLPLSLSPNRLLRPLGVAVVLVGFT